MRLETYSNNIDGVKEIKAGSFGVTGNVWVQLKTNVIVGSVEEMRKLVDVLGTEVRRRERGER